jgi:hypothetical protein
MEKQKEFGSKWTIISLFFQNRSDIQLKVRWIRTQHPAAQNNEENPLTEIEYVSDDGSEWPSIWKARLTLSLFMISRFETKQRTNNFITHHISDQSELI